MILDINECLNSPCHPNATCNNTDGSYICGCDMGYSGDEFNCTGIVTFDVLTTGGLAPLQSQVINCPWQFLILTCFPALMILDINECLTSPCHPNATCNNTDGSYICSCDMGYSGDGFNCTGMVTFDVLTAGGLAPLQSQDFFNCSWQI